MAADIVTALASHWPCQDNDGDLTVDAAVGSAGTLAGAASTSAASVAGPHATNLPLALSLDGTSADYISCGNVHNFTNASSFALAGWIKVNGASEIGPLVAQGAGADPRGYMLYWRGDTDTIQLYSGDDPAFASDAVFTEDNVWVHIAATYDGTTKTVTYYKNGVAAGSGGNGTIYDFIAPGTADFRIGRDAGSSAANNCLNGAICDVRVYTRVLTAEDVAALAAIGLASPPENTVPPAIADSPYGGEEVTSDNGTWDDADSYAYQWEFSDSQSFTVANEISGATSATYTIASRYIGFYLRCVVTATNGDGSTEEPSNVIGPVAPLVTVPAAATGSKFVKYNDRVTGSLAKSFYRNQATVDEQGIVRAADERRFSKAIGYSPPTTWEQTAIQITTSGTVYILGAGVDFDNVTPLFVTYNAINTRIRVHKGDDFAQQSSTVWTSPWITSQPGSNSYKPVSAIVHHGFIGLYCERTESGTVEGVSFVYSQDYGATWTGVPIVGDPSSFDVPAVAGGVTSGLSRGATWCFRNAFPVDGISDIRAAWMPWSDYIGSGVAGQAGLWKITRTTDTGTWTVHPNRLAYSIEFEAGASSHIHGTAVTTGGLLLHIGDTDVRNLMTFVELDLDDYENATATPTNVFGGYDTSAVQAQRHAQPAATAPSPTPGGHIAASDLGVEFVIYYGPMETAADRVIARSQIYRPVVNSGNTLKSFDALHTHFCKSRWLASAIDDRSVMFSKDGEHWAEVSLPDGSGSRVHICGDYIITTDSDRYVIRAPLPTFEVVKPLQISKGVTNLLADAADWAVINAAAADNVWTEVYYDGTTWRYTSDDSALEEQPDPPEWSYDAPVWLIEADNASSRSFGRRYIQASGNTIDSGGAARIAARVCNLTDRGSSFKFQLGTGSGGQSADGEWGAAIGTAYQWMKQYGNQTPENTDRANIEFDAASTGEVDTGARSLIAIEGLYANTGRIELYSTPPGTTYPPHEIEVASNFLTSINWTMGLVWRRPEEFSAATLVIATLFKDASDYIQIKQVPTTAELGEIQIDLVVDGSLEDTLVLGDNATTNMYPGEVCELILSGNEDDDVFASCRNGSWPVRTDSGLVTLAEGYNHLFWGDENYIPSSVQPILAFVHGKQSYDETAQAAWLAKSLARKASAGNPLIGGHVVGGRLIGGQLIGGPMVGGF